MYTFLQRINQSLLILLRSLRFQLYKLNFSTFFAEARARTLLRQQVHWSNRRAKLGQYCTIGAWTHGFGLFAVAWLAWSGCELSHLKAFVIYLKAKENRQSIPTNPFTIFELQNPSPDVPELHKIRGSRDLAALNLRKGSLGRRDADVTCRITLRFRYFHYKNML